MAQKEYVLAIALNAQKSKILLVRKLTPEWQRGLLNGPGGKIEQGETPLHAMIREFKEETGLLTGDEQWSSMGIVQNEFFKMYVFSLFDDLIYQAKTVEREVVEVFDVDIAMLEQCGVDNLYQLVDRAIAQ
jgi:8-oxo-dGTP diphosphatase